jgi:flagellar capping protein FliD
MEIRYKNNRESKVFDLKVNKGTKLLKKHFTTFVSAYNQVVDKLKIGTEF